MSLAQALAAQVSKPGPPCTVAVLIEQLPPEDVTVLTDALASPLWTNAKIARALKAEGHGIAAQTLGRHRKGECACGTR